MTSRSSLSALMAKIQKLIEQHTNVAVREDREERVRVFLRETTPGPSKATVIEVRGKRVTWRKGICHKCGKPGAATRRGNRCRKCWRPA
jgi:hypothetical protein